MDFPDKSEEINEESEGESKSAAVSQPIYTRRAVVEPEAPVAVATADDEPPMGEAEPVTVVEVPEVSEGGLRELSPERAALPWYAIHTYAGFEGRVKLTLEERIRSEGLQEKFGNILVPQETVVELLKGQKKTSSRKLFPSYIIVQLKLDDETWHVINSTPKVTGFVGDARNPMSLTQEEVDKLIEQVKGGGARPKPKVNFENGDSVKVIDGPFADFNGTVDEVKPDKGKLRVLISIFGRNTPVELDFVQVEKV